MHLHSRLHAFTPLKVASPTSGKLECHSLTKLVIQNRPQCFVDLRFPPLYFLCKVSASTVYSPPSRKHQNVDGTFY